MGSASLNDIWTIPDGTDGTGKYFREFRAHPDLHDRKNLMSASNGAKWILTSPSPIVKNLHIPATLNLQRFDADSPWISFHCASQNGRLQRGAAVFSPDGNWVTWGSSDGGRLTVVDLKALESGANELFQ